MEKLTFKAVFDKFKKIHGDTYDYSLVDYINSTTKVSIICREHGVFVQTPSSHLSGSGCPKCSLIKQANNRRKTSLSFIKKAKEIHGDTYDYSLVNYKDSKTEIIINCYEHGGFKQIPYVHVNQKSGCPKCSYDIRAQKLTKNNESFIKKVKKIHSDTYDYSLVEYKKDNVRVSIICREHGVFVQTPNSHLSGSGCPKCGCLATSEKLTKNNESFIDESKKIHGDTYDYSLVDYISSKKNIKIICREHGMFKQNPTTHLQGSGCPKCGCLATGKKLTKTLVEFLETAKIIHGDTYDYSLVDYISSKKKISIICREHGMFKQTPNGHLAGGCKQCSVMRIANSNRGDKNEFIEKAKEIHGNSYNYDKVVYHNRNNNVIITCLKHGDFKQVPKTHLQGSGCPICRESNGERDVRKYLEENSVKYIRQHRFSDCKYKNPLPFDFYLPELNTCIEFDGLQHYKPVKAFGGYIGFLGTKKRDAIKTNYCNINEIRLIRVPYFININKELTKKIIQNKKA